MPGSSLDDIRGGIASINSSIWLLGGSLAISCGVRPPIHEGAGSASSPGTARSVTIMAVCSQRGRPKMPRPGGR